MFVLVLLIGLLFWWDAFFFLLTSTITFYTLNETRHITCDIVLVTCSDKWHAHFIKTELKPGLSQPWNTTKYGLALFGFFQYGIEVNMVLFFPLSDRHCIYKHCICTII